MPVWSTRQHAAGLVHHDHIKSGGQSTGPLCGATSHRLWWNQHVELEDVDEGQRCRECEERLRVES